MKTRLYLLMAGCLMIACFANAKPKRINYGKLIYYEGEMVNKEPMGRGTLVLLSPKDKKKEVTLISGIFNGQNITHANITSSMLPTISAIGENTVKYNFGNKRGKAEEITFDLSNISFSEEGHIYTFGKFNPKLSLTENKEWVLTEPILNQNHDSLDDYTLCVSNEDHLIPDNITNYWSNPVKTLAYFKVLNGNLILPGTVYHLFNGVSYDQSSGKFYTKNPGYLIEHGDDKYYTVIEYDHKNNEPDLIIDDYMPYFIINNENQWRGSRVLDNGTVVFGTNDEVSVLIDGDNKEKKKLLYKGSLIDPMLPVSQKLTQSGLTKYGTYDFQFKTGILYTAGGEKKLINGELEEDIKNRLQKQGVEKDLIETVLSQEITEESAIYQQQQRDEEKRKLAEQKKELFAKHWSGSEVLFQGPLSGSAEANKLFKSIFGIDSSYFEGVAALYLNNSGEARWVLAVEPSQKAYSQGRGRALQILGFCKDFTKEVTGNWTIEDGDLCIDGKKIDVKPSPDYNSFIYNGMFSAKLKPFKP